MPSRRELALFAEAVATLTAASLAIRLLPFRTLVGTFGGGGRPASTGAASAAEVRLAVKRASARIPWKTMCFQEGVAAQWMLRRRGKRSVLHYGLRPGPDDLSAHVWISLDGVPVIGEEERDPHVEVAQFPPG